MNSNQTKQIDSSLSQIHSYSSTHPKIVLWRLLLSPYFSISFLLLILIRIFQVILGFLPPYFTDSYLSRLSQLSPEINDNSWVFSHCFLIIFLLYALCTNIFLNRISETFNFSQVSSENGSKRLNIHFSFV